MKRRTYIPAMVALSAGVKTIFAQPTAAKDPIVLYCDLSVSAEREQEMLSNFHDVFKPAAEKFPGYIDVKLLKLRTAFTGSLPAGVNYRFQLTYESEELRQAWIRSDVHRKAWPTIEKTLSTKNYTTLLFDSK